MTCRITVWHYMAACDLLSYFLSCSLKRATHTMWDTATERRAREQTTLLTAVWRSSCLMPPGKEITTVRLVWQCHASLNDVLSCLSTNTCTHILRLSFPSLGSREHSTHVDVSRYTTERSDWNTGIHWKLSLSTSLPEALWNHTFCELYTSVQLLYHYTPQS